MPKFLMQASLTLDGVRAITQQGATKRAATIGEVARAAGGRVEAVYFTPGRNEIFVIAELPQESIPALVWAVNGTGQVTVTPRRLLSPQEMDETIEKSKNLPVPGK
jgi:uncharacterized protein with GYD domain